jgi:hypothetical protein
MEEDKDRTNEKHERDVSYNITKHKSDKIQKERSVNLEKNNQEEEGTLKKK